MKLHNVDDDVLVSSIGEETQFSFKASKHAFKIMSNNLYSNKIRAIVRELSTNAYDAHVAAGKKEVPFSITIPTRFEPFFAVRDYGTSMTDDQIKTLYTTFFDSTKGDSNDFVGALGLGSKSPFSYANSFSVTAYLNGVARVYSCYLDKTGCPAITSLGISETDAENGIEIKVPVETNDVRTFEREISFVHSFFEVKPLYSHEFSIDSYVAYNNEFLAGNVLFNNNNSNTTALQGNVAYPLSISEIRDVLNDEQNVVDDRSDVRDFIGSNKNYLIKFNIGDLDIAPSREALSYDERTVDNIVKKIREIIQAAKDRFTIKVAKTTDLFKLYDMRGALVSIIGIAAYKTIGAIDDITCLGDISVAVFNNDNMTPFSFYKLKSNKIKADYSEYVVSCDNNLKHFSNYISEDSHEKKTVHLRNIFAYQSFDLRNTMFVVNDNESKDRMVRGVVRSVTSDNPYDTSMVIVFNGTKQELYDYFGDKFAPNIAKVKSITEIKLAEKTESNKDRIKKEKDNVEIIGIFSANNQRMTYGELSKLKRVCLVDNSTSVHFPEVDLVLKLYNLSDRAVIRFNNIEKAEKLCNQYKIDYIVLFDKIKDSPIPDAAAKYHVQCGASLQFIKTIQHNKLKQLVKDAGLFYTEYTYSEAKTYEAILRLTRAETKLADEVKAENEKVENFNKKYPLLTKLLKHNYYFEQSEIMEYVDLVNKANK